MLTPSCVDSDCSWGLFGRWHVMHTRDGNLKREPAGSQHWLTSTKAETCVFHTAIPLPICLFIIILVSRSRSPRPSPAPPSESQVLSLPPSLKRLKFQWMSKSKMSAFTWVIYSQTGHRWRSAAVEAIIVWFNQPSCCTLQERSSSSAAESPLHPPPSSAGTTGTLCHHICLYSLFFCSAALKNRFCIYFIETWLWCTPPPPFIFSFPFMFSLKIIANFYVYFRFTLEILFSFILFCFGGVNTIEEITVTAVRVR